MTAQNTICWFHDNDSTDLGRVGGKGANLGRLVSAGFPVPLGFTVSADAYREFVSANGLAERVLAHLEGVRDPEEAEARSAEVREWLRAQPIPDEIATAVKDAYAALGDGAARVAVRSSATAEDLPEASFAGQQDTYLNVQGADELLEHVRRCWASLWTARAVSYRVENGFDHGVVNLAVVVQEMIESDLAGVMFTANPVSGRFDETVINSSYGLGEAVVSGLVTPDTFVVQPRERRVSQREIAEKVVEIVYAPGGVEERPVETARARRSSLSDEAALELADLGVWVTDYYKAPQDIEWAFRDGEFYLLQARPITTLGERPAFDPRDHWTRAMFEEILPDAPSPVFCSVLERIFTEMLEFTFTELGQNPPDDIPGVGIFYSQPYFNVRYIRSALSGLPEATGERLTQRIANPFGEEEPEESGGFRMPRLSELKLAWHMFGASRKVRRELPGVVKAYYKELAPYQKADPAKMTDDELADGLWHLAYEVLPPLVKWDFLLIAALGFSERLMDSAVVRSGVPDPEGVHGALMSGMTGNMTMKTNKALWDLAQTARDEPDVAAALRDAADEQLVERVRAAAGDGEFARQLEGFLAEYGHREVRMDIVYPTWGEDPTPVLQFVRSYLAVDASTDPAAQEAKLAGGRREAITHVQDGLGQSLTGRQLYGRLFKWASGSSEALGTERDTMHFHWTASFPVLRGMLIELGRRMAEEGIIDRGDDVWCLRIDDLPGFKEDPQPLVEPVGRRRRAWERDRRLAWPMEIVDGREVYQEAPAAFAVGQNRLRGVAGSPGQITGRVRLINGPEDFGKLKRGEILVAPLTNPVWTPLFAIAGAVVTETGGVLSHGAIVAREYGIPAVMGVAGVTRALNDGRRVTVDGTTGVVSLEEV